MQVKHVQFTDVLGGGVVCAANEDPARERKGFVVERSRNGKSLRELWKEEVSRFLKGKTRN